MRIHADRDRACASGHYAVVNDVAVKFCREVDTEEGWADVYACNREGEMVPDPASGGCITVRLVGEVRLVPRNAVDRELTPYIPGVSTWARHTYPPLG